MTSIYGSFRAALFATAVFACTSGAAVAADTQAAWEDIMENTAASSVCATMAVGGTGVGDNRIPVLSAAHPFNRYADLFRPSCSHALEFTLQNNSETTNPQMNGGADLLSLATIIVRTRKAGNLCGHLFWHRRLAEARIGDHQRHQHDGDD